MENFKELQELIRRKEDVEQYIKRIKTIGFLGNGLEKSAIGITDSKSGRYTFLGLEDIIGTATIYDAISVFEELLNDELQKAKETVDQELSRFNIIKQ